MSCRKKVQNQHTVQPYIEIERWWKKNGKKQFRSAKIKKREFRVPSGISSGVHVEEFLNWKENREEKKDIKKPIVGEVLK